eukprot:g7629.t1
MLWVPKNVSNVFIDLTCASIAKEFRGVHGTCDRNTRNIRRMNEMSEASTEPTEARADNVSLATRQALVGLEMEPPMNTVSLHADSPVLTTTPDSVPRFSSTSQLVASRVEKVHAKVIRDLSSTSLKHLAARATDITMPEEVD